MIAAVISVESESGRVHLERLCSCSPEGLDEPQQVELKQLTEKLSEKYGRRRSVSLRTAKNFASLYQEVSPAGRR